MTHVRKSALLLAAVLALATAACASAAGGKGSRQDLLTREQIMSVDAQNLYQVVARLRPRWLNVRSEQSFGLQTQVVVYQGQTYVGEAQTLDQFSPDMAYQLRYVDGTTASSTLPGLGSRHVAGAIIIDTRPPAS